VKYCDERLSVGLFASISPELHVLSSLEFLHSLPMAVARSSSGGVAICYVLPVSWTTSHLYIGLMGIMGRADTAAASGVTASSCAG